MCQGEGLELQVPVSEENVEPTGAGYIGKSYSAVVIPRRIGFLSKWWSCGRTISSLRSLANK
jgi:hypothetical protein